MPPVPSGQPAARQVLSGLWDARGRWASPYADLKDELEGLRSSLTEALEQQTATAEILRVISSSPTDLQPIFDAIAESAVRLCDGLYSAVYRVDEDLIHLVALNESRPEVAARDRVTWPRALDRRSIAGRVILDRVAMQSGDIERETRVARADSRARPNPRLSQSADGADAPR